MVLRRPEILAPAGDAAAMQAAIRAGADAVYFGLQGFNARARAANFDAVSLAETMSELHRHGVKGYVTLNTLVFDDELQSVEAAVRACAAAGVDAVIVQDLGVARLVRALAPELPMHASTQMTCTDASAVELARELGASRVILARELSLQEIARIQSESSVELEVFVHGALCVAYSGQCLTSEAIGGRSANRGACAQACRLPYQLLVDGTVRELGERAYLLSPEDLEASALVPELMELGIRSLKIEGRLKGPDYVAAATRLYRRAVDGALGEERGPPLEALREDALQAYSRGSGPGFLRGVDHQRLVEGRACDHRGLLLGELLGLSERRGRRCLQVRLERPLAKGAGILVEGGHAGEGELGGRVWSIQAQGAEREQGQAGEVLELWLGPDKEIGALSPGRRVWKTSDPARERAVLAEVERHPRRRALSFAVRGRIGEAPRFEAWTDDGARTELVGDTPLAQADAGQPLAEVLAEKLGRLGDTPFALGRLELELPQGARLPPSSLNRARRALVEAIERQAQRAHPLEGGDHRALLSRARVPDRAPPPPGLFVLCRSEPQADAALAAGADGVYLDFLELTGLSATVAKLRVAGRFVGVAPPRIRKPGEEKIDRHLAELEPDAILVRGLGALRDGAGSGRMRIGDFSLNVTNRLSAAEVLSRDLAAFTPSFDLDQQQLLALLEGPFGAYAELVVQHPMPLFHMEHCVFAALLSSGKDYRDCGRPCEHHQLELQDRAGMAHPLAADVGCRNTVFHAVPQSAAHLIADARAAGVRRFRIELVREDPERVAHIVTSYRRLLAGQLEAAELWRGLRTPGGYGVVRGSLRVLAS